MLQLAGKALSLLLTMYFVGFASMCLCIKSDASPRKTANTHACCKRDRPTPTRAPCSECNLKHKQLVTASEKSERVGPLFFSSYLVPLVQPVAIAPALSHARFENIGTTPPPPLLLDLYHCACLLTV